MMARKREGFKELTVYLSEDDYELLDQYMRFKTKERHLSIVAAELLSNALRKDMVQESIDEA